MADSNATYGTSIAVDLPDFPAGTVLFTLDNISNQKPFFVGGNNESFPRQRYTLTLDANGQGTQVLPTPDNTGTEAVNWRINLPNKQSYTAAIAYSASTQQLSDILASVSTTTDPDTITAALANKLDDSGDSATGPYTITSPSSNTDDTYPLKIIVSPDTNTFPSPGLVIVNPNDGTGANRYDGEAHIRLQAGATRNERRYIYFNQYDKSNSQVIFGVNASGDIILYDTVKNVHRFWGPTGSGSNYFAVNATGTGRVRINYHPSDTTGTGGLAVHDGTANGPAIFTVAEVSSQGRIYLDNDGNYYLNWRQADGTSLWLVGAIGSGKDWRIYNDSLDRDAIIIDYATNVTQFGGGLRERVVALGSIGGGTQDIDVAAASFYTGTIDTSTTTFTFSNWPPSGTLGQVTLELTNPGSQTLNFPVGTTFPGGTTPTWTVSGVDTVTLYSIDGGTTIRAAALQAWA